MPRRWRRRLGWRNLSCGIEKSMGLKAGEKILRLAVIRVVGLRVRWRPASSISSAARIGGCTPDTEINRIRFEYVR